VVGPCTHGRWLLLALAVGACADKASPGPGTEHHTGRDSASTHDSDAVHDSAPPLDSHPPVDSPPPTDTVDTSDTAPVEPGCLEVDARLDQLSTHSVDGLPGTSDGLSGQLILAETDTSTDAWVLGRAAVLPGGRPSDGTIARYPGLGAPEAWLGIDPSEGELEVLARGDLDEVSGSDLVVGIEHPGLVGARVVVLSAGWGAGNVLDAGLRFESDATGASPLPIVADTDGDGGPDLHIGWKGELERWSGRLPDGDYTAGDGDQVLTGSTRQWGVGGDVDGDGYTDLVVATYEGPALIRGSAGGLSSTVDTPDHRFDSGEDGGADIGGIALGTSAAGDSLVAIGRVAVEADDSIVDVWTGLEDDVARVTIGETGRATIGWANLDGAPGDELVLGRVPTSATAGGLWLFAGLEATPMRVSAEGSTGVVGPLFQSWPTGEDRDALVVVDPWGAAERHPRLYTIDPCGIR